MGVIPLLYAYGDEMKHGGGKQWIFQCYREYGECQQTHLGIVLQKKPFPQ